MTESSIAALGEDGREQSLPSVHSNPPDTIQHDPLAGEAELGDWIALLKPRVMTLVVFTGLIGLLVAPGHLHPILGFTAVLCIAVAAGASGAINMWYDRDIDAVMHRTSNRPVPAGRILPNAALGFGVTLALASVLVMYLATNVAAAVVLALFAHGDYARAGVPMLPVVAGARETRRQILIYTVLLLPLSLAPWMVGFSGPIYGIVTSVLGAVFLACAWRVWTDAQDPAGVSLSNDAPARTLFKYSILYLFVLFAALAVDRLVG